MGKSPEGVTLDDDELRRLAASIERGLADVEAGRARSTEEVLAYLQDQRRLRNRG